MGEWDATGDSDSLRRPKRKDDVAGMKIIFEEAKRTVKPIVEREAESEVIRTELMRMLFKDGASSGDRKR